MPPRPKLSQIRNIGIAAHIDAGKTTVTERVLFYAGRIHRMGEVHDGQATMDWRPQEQERGITITAAVTAVQWGNTEIHIIDTPGHVDFTVEVERAMRVLDGLIVVLDAVSAVEPQTETVWHQADRYRVPRLLFVNKMDRVGADFHNCVQQVEERLKARPLIVQLPIFTANNFTAMVDVIDGRAFYFDADDEGREVRVAEAPEEMAEEIAAAREALIEGLADEDDELATAYLDGEEISDETIRAALRRQTITGSAVPVFCGTALRNKGVQPLIDAVVDYLPSPKDLPPVKGAHPVTGAEEERPADPKADFSALAYKVQMDEGRKMVYFRIYSGTVKAGAEVLNVTKNKKDRIARLVLVHADRKERVDEARTGDLVGAMGMKITSTGDTLAAPHAPLLLEDVKFLDPVISLAVEPRSTRDLEKLKQVFDKIGEEDPTIRVKIDDDSGQTVLSGMGELHLDVVLDRVRRDFGVEVNTGQPLAVCRESIDAKGVGTGVFDRSIGPEGAEQALFAEVSVEVRPRTRGTGNAVHNEDGAIEDQALIDAMIEGGTQALQSGPVAGWPVEDVEVGVRSVKQRAGATTPQAVHIATTFAVQDALKNAGARLLVPIMRLEVATPEENVGEVIGDLQAKGGKVESIDPQGARTLVTAFVPLPKSFGYATQVRSLTQGRATFSMTFDRFDLA